MYFNNTNSINKIIVENNNLFDYLIGIKSHKVYNNHNNNQIWVHYNNKLKICKAYKINYNNNS